LADQVIEVENLTKIFDGKLVAVNNLNFTVESRAIYGFLGPNGAGKTTTIRLLLGLIRPTAGEVRIFGERMTPSASALRRRMGYLPTNPRFPPKMTPITYLDFVGRLFRLGSEERKNRLSALIRSVGLLGDSAREIGGFSTGMLTRLGLAAALMNDPELLILDEPTSGLDPSGRKSTLELIEELGKEKTIFVSSHILGDMDRVCTSVGVISQGKSIFSGTIKEIKKSIRGHSIRLEVEGDMEKLCAALKGVKSVRGFERRSDFALEIEFDPAIPMADAIRETLGLVSSQGLDLISVTSSSSSIEDAFVKLLRDEESRGFLRAT
jgi:ABC-2 type transport system ATP-binding protein